MKIIYNENQNLFFFKFENIKKYFQEFKEKCPNYCNIKFHDSNNNNNAASTNSVIVQN
jgi:hypothetical protein